MQTLPEADVINNSLFRALVNQVSALSRNLVGSNATFAEVETGSLRIANLAVREHLQRDLQRRSDALGEELLVDEKHVHQHEEGTVPYHSLNGPLEVRRFTYREVGVRNGPTVVPLELATGLVEGATPALGYSVTLGYAQGELRSYLESMAAAHRAPPSRSTLERLAKEIGAKAQQAAPRIEAYLRQSELLPEEAHGVSMGLDRVAAPMEEDREEGAAPKTRRKVRTKPYVRKKPKPIDVNYRMPYVGTFSVVDEVGEELSTRRYTALPEEGPAEIVRRMMLDLRNARRQEPTLKVGVVQDGADELWNAMTAGLETEGVKHWVGTIDRFHLNERLGKALRLVEPQEAEREKLLSQWNDRLDRSNKAIDEVLDWLGQHIDGLEKKSPPDAVDEYLGHMIYLENNRHRMRYRTTKRNGLPVGSGLTEGTCKSVVGHRACGSGQRWRPAGLAAALTLRAIHRSERLPGFWNHLSRRYTAEIRRAA
jgi:hypothetical protein